MCVTGKDQLQPQQERRAYLFIPERGAVVGNWSDSMHHTMDKACYPLAHTCPRLCPSTPASHSSPSGWADPQLPLGDR